MPRHITLTLTLVEARALLTTATSAEAGDLAGLFDHGREVNAALRAIDNLRHAIATHGVRRSSHPTDPTDPVT